MAEFRGDPIDDLDPLAAAGVPILHVCDAAGVNFFDSAEMYGHGASEVLVGKALGVMEELKQGGKIRAVGVPNYVYLRKIPSDPTAPCLTPTCRPGVIMASSWHECHAKRAHEHLPSHQLRLRDHRLHGELRQEFPTCPWSTHKATKACFGLVS